MDKTNPIPQAVEANPHPAKSVTFISLHAEAIVNIVGSIILAIATILAAFLTANALVNANQTSSPSVPAFYHGPVAKWPVTVQEAAAALHVDPTVLNNFIPGGPDGKPAGWILGDTTIVFNAFLPAGTCVDYDPRSLSIQGEVYWADTAITGDKARAYMKSDGQVHNAYSLTVYWTPCSHLT